MQISDQAPEPTVVAVLGSCATRDNFNRRFNPTYRESYTCSLAQNQTSMIALMSEPVLDEWEPLGEMSDYDRWNVTTDLTRSFLTDLAELKPAYVIVDFFADIHFGVLRLRDGRYVTDNRWKTRKTDWYQQLVESDGFTRVTIMKDTEEYLALWRDAMARFVDYLRQVSPQTRLIVHRGYNAAMIQLPDRPRPVRLQKHKPQISKLNVPRANKLWGELDDYAIAVGDAAVIDLTDTAWTTYPEHPWGPFYVHFPPEYNHRFLAELHKITLAEAVPKWLMHRVTDIEQPRVEQAYVEEARLRELVRRLQARLDDASAEEGGDSTFWASKRFRSVVRRVRFGGVRLRETLSGLDIFARKGRNLL